MKKAFATIALFALFATFALAQATAQARPVLAILPFTGGTGGDGETIASLLSFEPAITGAFTVVPRTAALNALFEEHRFQLAGLTDADTIAEIGRMLNARFVLSGSIRRVGERNLVIATIIDAQTFEQVAGYYLTYGSIEEVRPELPFMARSMAATAFRDTAGLPNLAVLPLNIAGISVDEAETLAMILAIEIGNAGGFTVLPRTSAIESALAEHGFGMLGFTTEEGRAALGRAFNAQYVLSAGASSLGAINMFTAQILNLRDGSQRAGASRDYRAITEGVDLMFDLARFMDCPNGGLVRVQSGSFLMGSPEGTPYSWDNERPVRRVTVSGFSISRHPVTQGEWYNVMGTRPSFFTGERDSDGNPVTGVDWRNLPVERVSWWDAIEFANARSRRAGLTPAYAISGTGANRTVTWNRNANGYRLPTEAEWEFAARGGVVCRGNFTFSGSNVAGEVAWLSTNSGRRTREVGTLRPNALGIYDMSGNVWEWVYDRWGEYPNQSQTNPTGPAAGGARVIRGGSWYFESELARSAFRYAGYPVYRSLDGPAARYGHLGFRVVCSLVLGSSQPAPSGGTLGPPRQAVGRAWSGKVRR